MALIDKIVAALSSKEDIEAAKKLNEMSDDELKIMMKALEQSKIRGISFEDALQEIIAASKAFGEGLESCLRGNDSGVSGNDKEGVARTSYDTVERDDNKHN